MPGSTHCRSTRPPRGRRLLRGSLVALQARGRRSHGSGRLAAATLAAAALGLLGGAAAAAAETAYVSNATSSAVTPINLATGKVGKPIKVAGPTSSIAITPNGKTAYAPSYKGHLLHPIDLATGKAGKPIEVGREPEALAITPNGKFAYVANEEAAPPSVSVVDIATNKVVATIPVGCEPVAVAFTPNGKIAYVADKAGQEITRGLACVQGSVTAIDIATKKVVATIKVGLEPESIAITPDGRTAYVADGASGSVTPIDIATGEAGKEIKVGKAMVREEGHEEGKEPTWIAITPNGKTAYVSDGRAAAVVPIDLATQKAGKPIKVGRAPRGLAITANGKTLYVADEQSESVTPIDIATGKAGKEIKVAGEPDDIAILPEASHSHKHGGRAKHGTRSALAPTNGPSHSLRHLKMARPSDGVFALNTDDVWAVGLQQGLGGMRTFGERYGG